MLLQKRGSNTLRRWLWALDGITFLLLLLIMAIGMLLITTASPSVAERLKLPSFYFVHRQLIFLIIATSIILITVSLKEKTMQRLAVIGFIACITMMIVVLFIGEEVKGAKRWITVLGVSIQPSEILKPFFIYIIGSILAEKFLRQNFPGFAVAFLVYSLSCTLLILQPDFGMVITYTVVFVGQLFLAGLSLWWVFGAIICAAAGGIAAYTMLPHVARRVNLFLNPETSENFQVEKSLESYISGGLLGKGPGEGIVKTHLPDSHTDFIFAVAGEELGAIVSMFIIFAFLAVIIRSITILLKQRDLMSVYAGSGVVILFALQSVFNIGVTLHLFPTKGMTLPFISYGGSSAVSYAICFGMLLQLTKNGATLTKKGR